MQSTGTAPETTTVANVTVELVPDSRFVRNALRIVSGLAKPQRDATRCMGFRCPRAWYRIVATRAKMESTRVSHRFTRKSEARCFSPRNETTRYTHHSRASTALCQRPLDRAELAHEPTPASPYTDQALLSSASNRKKNERRVAGDRYSAIPTYDIALFSYRRRAA